MGIALRTTTCGVIETATANALNVTGDTRGNGNGTTRRKVSEISYAEVQDVKSRAGVLSKAWSANSTPGDGDLEMFAQQVSDEMDARVGAAGFSVPVTDDIALRALVGVAADKALLLAIDATWPGSTGDVKDLRDMILARVQAYDLAMQEGELAALLYLGATSAGAEQGGAANYWTEDAMQYEYWDRFATQVYGYPRWSLTDPFGVPAGQGPRFSRTMRL